MYLQLSSVKYEDEDEEYTKDLCKNCFPRTEEDTANWSHQALKAYQQQRRTGGMMEISRGTVAPSKKRTRAKRLLARAADAPARRR